MAFAGSGWPGPPSGPPLRRPAAPVQPQGSRAAPRSALRRGAPAGEPLRPGRKAIARSERDHQRGAVGCSGGALPKTPGQKYRLEFLSVHGEAPFMGMMLGVTTTSCHSRFPTSAELDVYGRGREASPYPD